MNRISKISMMLFLTYLMMCGGCRLLKNAASDIDGWNISACVDGFDVCWELYRDNKDKFADGFTDAMNAE